MTSDIINYSSRHYRPNYAVKQECSTATVAAPGDGRFAAVHELPASSPYWTPPPPPPLPSSEQLVTCVVGHPSGSAASSTSSFVDDESTSYEDITYNSYGPSAVPTAAVTNVCDDYGLYHHHGPHQQYGNVGGYYETGTGYHQLVVGGYDDKPPPYDNNNAADACDMNAAGTVAAVVTYDDPYVPQLDGQPPQQYHHVQHQRPANDGDERSQRRPPVALQPPVPVVRVVKRRNTANKKERRRTQSINNAFSDLRDCIPNVPSDTKLSKIKTLRLATSYISYLMDVLDSEDPDTTDGFKADLSAHATTRRSSGAAQHANAAGSSAAVASRDKSQMCGARLATADPMNDRHHDNQYHHKRGKGRTGWPQDVWALELKQEQV